MFRKQPEDTEHLRTKGSEAAVAEEGTASEVRPRDPHDFRPSERELPTEEQGSNHSSSLGRQRPWKGCAVTRRLIL